jgi:hypothetical protein
MPQPGTIWHTIRHANGAWQPAFVELEPLEASDPGQFTAIGAGAITDELELAAVLAVHPDLADGMSSRWNLVAGLCAGRLRRPAGVPVG